jgi:hypothetical protein
VDFYQIQLFETVKIIIEVRSIHGNLLKKHFVSKSSTFGKVDGKDKKAKTVLSRGMIGTPVYS